CSKKNAPMLVSGSQVTIVTRKVFGGPLGGRFGAIYLDLMDIKDGMKLAFKLSDKHDVPVTANTAQLISEISHGNPFYIWCAFASIKENKDLTTAKGVEEVYKFEVTDRRGKIRDFWNEHFKRNMDLLNTKNKFGLNQKIIFYILKNKDRSVTYKEIAKKFKISERNAYSRLEDLLKADIVTERAYGIVKGLKDKMLEMCLNVIFKPIIEDIDELIVAEEINKQINIEIEELKKKLKSMRGYINTIVGEEAEIMIKRTMNRFNNQEVDGNKYFNINKKIKLPKFDKKPYSRVISGFEEEKYQIDFYGKKITKKEKIIWIGESKNWSEKVGIEVVEDLLAKIEQVKKQENTEEVIGWLYGKSGFEDAAIKLMQEKGILYSDKNNLLDLMDFLSML
ncbi:MAG: winged helix-turn-helix domain-containing protein, partial [Methanosarcinales archaeon]